MATSIFDRSIVLSEQGVENLIALIEKWKKNPPKPIESLPDGFVEGTDESLKRLFHFDN